MTIKLWLVFVLHTSLQVRKHGVTSQQPYFNPNPKIQYTLSSFRILPSLKRRSVEWWNVHHEIFEVAHRSSSCASYAHAQSGRMASRDRAYSRVHCAAVNPQSWLGRFRHDGLHWYAGEAGRQTYPTTVCSRPGPSTLAATGRRNLYLVDYVEV